MTSVTSRAQVGAVETEWDFWPNAYTEVTVYEDEGRDSLVLDVYGKPYYTKPKKLKMGFDLTPKGNK